MVEIALFERQWVTLSANFRGKGGSSTNEFWRQKTRVPGLSRGVVSRFDTIPACVTWRRHAYRQAIMAITRAGKNLSDLLSLQYKENKGKFAASNGRLKAKSFSASEGFAL